MTSFLNNPQRLRPLSRMYAARAPRSGVLLRWRTASESQTLGFNVYRQRNGKLLKLNRTLIPSVFGGTTTGHAYSWLDRHPSGAGTRYRVQAVGLDGNRMWVGSTTA